MVKFFEKKPTSLPTILNKREMAKSRLFTIEAVDLQFSNGEQRVFERMQSREHHAVMIVPINEQGELLLVKEYAVGTETYEIGFPKGLVDEGETLEQAANRELKEEIGFGANRLTKLKQITLAPNFFDSPMTLFLGQDLYPEMLLGDEPEPLEVVSVPYTDIESLLSGDVLTEARSLTALLFAQRFLSKSTLS